MFRFLIFLFIAPLFCADKTICLNMIVKNESLVIEECLASVKGLIDYWVIFDTGSTDGTQELIRNALKDIPGELHESPWVDFSHNRNEVLDIAKNKSDYSLMMDADETLLLLKPIDKANLNKSYYGATVRREGVDCPTLLLIDNRLNWRWKGVLHEEVLTDDIESGEYLDTAFKICNHRNGFRSQDPEKYQKDAATLEKALLTEPNNSHYVFYLGQTYFVSQEYALAMLNYQKRLSMGGTGYEIWWSLYGIALCAENLKLHPRDVIEAYSICYQYNPHRLEPLYRLALYHFKMGNSLLSYIICQHALSIIPTKSHDTEHWIYDYGLLVLFADTAAAINRNDEARAAYLKALEANLPEKMREQILKII